MSAEQKPRERIVQINANVYLSERELLNQKARAAEMNVSQFISKLIADATVEVSLGVGKELREMNVWLARINSNLNMLAKTSNIYKDQTYADLINYNLGTIRDEVMAMAQACAAAAPVPRKRRTKRQKDAGVAS